jgi:para-aminobenzoate synthetase
MVFADRAVAFDHADGSVYLLALGEGDRTTDAATTAWLDQMTATLTATRRSTDPEAPTLTATTVEPCDGPVDNRAPTRPVPRAYRRLPAGDHCWRDLRGVASPRRSVPSVHSIRWPPIDDCDARAQAPFGALLRLGELAVLSCSPERFLRVDRTGTGGVPADEGAPAPAARPWPRTSSGDSICTAA